MSLNQISVLEYQNRKINLLPILVAQQLVLLPLYFFIPVWITVLNCLVLGIVYFSQIRRRFRIPVWVKVLVTLMAVAAVLFSFRKFAGRDAGVALIAIMYGLKIIEIKSQRDVYVLMLLGFFLLLAGFLFSQSPLIAIYQFIPVAAILNALTSIHSLSRSQKLVEHSLFSTVKKLLKYLLLALPLMIVLFIFFPRLSGPIWKMPGGGSGTSGVSDTMSPGAISSLRLSDNVAFRIKFNGAPPNEFEMYWRTLVLDEFDGLSWSRHLLEANEALTSKPVITDIGSYRYEISLEKTGQSWLTFLDRPVNVPKRVKLYQDYSARVTHRLLDRTRYKAESKPLLKIDLQLSTVEKSRNTLLPDGENPRSLAWARELRAKYKSDKEYILAILSIINRQEYFYTLTPPIMARDTVDSFWFDHQKGFCEHYAGSLVFLARAASIPARVVVGYQGAEQNPLSDYWIVRYANAHAWTEIWFKNEGWVRVDPTAAIAPHRIEEQLRLDYSQRESLFGDFGFDAVDLNDISWLKQFQYWMDKANTGWNDWVLDYNQDSQRELFAGLGLDRLNKQQISFLMISILSVFLALISFKWLRVTDSREPIQISFNLLNDKLSKFGLSVEDNQGVSKLISKLEFTEKHVIELERQSVDALLRALKRYVFLRYHQTKMTEKQQKDFHRQVKALRIRTN